MKLKKKKTKKRGENLDHLIAECRVPNAECQCRVSLAVKGKTGQQQRQQQQQTIFSFDSYYRHYLGCFSFLFFNDPRNGRLVLGVLKWSSSCCLFSFDSNVVDGCSFLSVCFTSVTLLVSLTKSSRSTKTPKTTTVTTETNKDDDYRQAKMELDVLPWFLWRRKSTCPFRSDRCVSRRVSMCFYVNVSECLSVSVSLCVSKVCVWL